MFCYACGSRLQDADAYCCFCGKPVPGSPSWPQTPLDEVSFHPTKLTGVETIGTKRGLREQVPRVDPAGLHRPAALAREWDTSSGRLKDEQAYAMYPEWRFMPLWMYRLLAKGWWQFLIVVPFAMVTCAKLFEAPIFACVIAVSLFVFFSRLKVPRTPWVVLVLYGFALAGVCILLTSSPHERSHLLHLFDTDNPDYEPSDGQ
jgi:hypothetical protein